MAKRPLRHCSEQERAADRERLRRAAEELLSSEGWARWLRVRSMFRAYSAGNCMLLAQQCHERGIVPQHIAGFRTWLKLGRCVRRGETALRIFVSVTIKDLEPVEVKVKGTGTGLIGAKAIAAGGEHSMALLTGGTVMAWGENRYGQLGNGASGENVYSEEAVEVKGAERGQGHRGRRRPQPGPAGSGKVMAWGYNADGELGNGTTTNSSVPVEVKAPSGVIGISGGGYHSLAISPQPPPPHPSCEAGNEDNGNGQVADQNGNSGGEFSDDECNPAQNATLEDPNHSMSFKASSHGSPAFSSDALGAPVATTVGEGIANGQAVKYVLVQTGGLLGTQLYSLTLSNASGVVYQRTGSLIAGAINVRH